MTRSNNASTRGVQQYLPALALTGVLFAAAALLPIDQGMEMEILLVFAMAQAWNLLCGYTGLLSFGHQAFVGVGAYSLFMAVNTLGVPPILGLAISAAVCAGVAIVIALLLQGSRDVYFSIGILVLADSLRLLVGQWEWVGSARGLVLDTANLNLDNHADMIFWMALTLAVVTHFGVFALLRSPFGLGLMAIRDNESAAASVGVASKAAKLGPFLISAIVCGIAGGIYYLSILYVDPVGAFDLDWQTRILFIVIVGGVGTLEGPFIGTAIYFALRALFRDAGDVFLILQGVIAILVMLFAPQGIWGLIESRTNFQLFPTRWLSEKT